MQRVLLDFGDPAYPEGALGELKEVDPANLRTVDGRVSRVWR